MNIGSTADGKTYWTLIEDAGRREPDRPLLADDHGRSLTAGQLRDAACATAGGRLSNGTNLVVFVRQLCGDA